MTVDRGLSARRALFALVACLLVTAALLASAASAPARVPKSCGELRFGGEEYGLLAHRTSCRFARHWAELYQRTGREPSGWRCTGAEEFTEEARCARRRADGYSYFLYFAED